MTQKAPNIEFFPHNFYRDKKKSLTFLLFKKCQRSPSPHLSHSESYRQRDLQDPLCVLSTSQKQRNPLLLTNTRSAANSLLQISVTEVLELKSGSDRKQELRCELKVGGRLSVMGRASFRLVLRLGEPRGKYHLNF